ncbi:MAG: DedA family protein [Deltaproteobacteria bacterium]|nr:DedA family protein [Deltaproteobacteria bacterium]
MDFFNALSGNIAYTTIFLLLLLCGLGIPLPEELTLLMAGYLSYEGAVRLEPMWMVCVAGITIGDALLFLIGKKWGTKIAAHPKIVKFWHLERQAKIKNYFKKHGTKTIFVVRFLSGLRGPAHMLAGSMGFSFWKYLLTNFSAVLIHVTLVAGLGYVFGNHIDAVRKDLESAKHVVIVIVLIVAFALFLKYSYSSKKIPGS